MTPIRRVLLLTTFLFPIAAYAAEEEGFTPLFNGKDLSGWVPVNVAPNTFTVRDNLIVCNGVPTGVMRTDRHYENYILELEYKHLVPGGNAGLFIWSDPVTSTGVPFTRSIEVQILDGSESESHTSHGDVFAIHGAKMKPDRPHPKGAMRCLPSEKRAKPAGEWNHYRVVCNDGVIKLSVNGKEVSGASQCHPRVGYICLESEGGTVHYRNIRIKELPSTHPKPQDAAPLDDGFKSIYTGVDLSGWKKEPGHEGHWQPKDWVLSYDGRSDAPDKRLWTEKDYGDFVMIVDWRRPKDANETNTGAVLFRGPLGASVDLDQSATGNAAARPAGEWNRFLITVKGSACTVLLNGRPFAEHDLATLNSRGPVGLRYDGPIEFANLYIKELK
jgi:hypothetical protein